MGAKLLYGWNPAAAEWLPMAVDATGRLRISVPARSEFKATRPAFQLIPDITFTKVQFNTEIWDTLADFDSTVNYRFVCRNAGKHLFISAANFVNLNNANRFIIDLYQNGGLVANLCDGTTGVASAPVGAGSAILDLAVGNFVEVYVYHNFGAARNITARFEGHQLSW